MKPQPKTRGGAIFWESPAYDNGDGVHYFHTRETAGIMSSWLQACPYGVAGDRLWVRETWRVFGGPEYEYQQEQRSVVYRATAEAGDRGPWKPSIFMRRWASRIKLEITKVRVEQLGQISEEDSAAEGMIRYGEAQWQSGTELPVGMFPTAREAFKLTWNAINSRRGFEWKTSPWLWVVDFRRIT